MAEKFNLAALLDDVSSINTERKQIEYIALSNILSDPNNRYELSGIEELAANIEMFGLQQPLEVRPHKEFEGYYTVTSGHRRKAALDLLDEKEVPCIVVEAMASDALQELRLIFANSDTRRMTAAEQAWQAERIEALLYDLKGQGYEFPGRMRDHVAAISKMSASKLARLKVIRDGLRQPELKKAFEGNRLSEGAAYELARRSDAVQSVAADMQEVFGSVNVEGVQRILDGIEQDLNKPKSAPVVERPVEQRPSASPLPNDVKAYLDAREDEDFEYRMILGELIESGWLKFPGNFGGRKLNIDGLKCSLRYRSGGDAKLGFSGSQGHGLGVRRERGRVITRTWTEAYDAFCAIALDMANREMIDPNVSRINTKAQWQSGTPENGGKHYCKVEVEGVAVHQILIYNNGWKLLSGGHAIDDGCTVLGWWPLPEG